MNKDDIELLGLAAKAAGIEYDAEQSKPNKVSGCFWGLWLMFDGEPPETARRYFNPLTDDGDALRLACDLGLRVFPIARTSSGADCSAVGSATGERLSEVSDSSLDTYAATRRAITRAAAEIGRTL